jgi:putative heme-binding domain-containing protein
MPASLYRNDPTPIQPSRPVDMSIFYALPSSRRLALLILLALLPSLAVFLATHSRLRSAQQPESTEKLEIRSGDHICIIGNTLADRMQHDGWLETYLQTRFPKKQLVFRNLGFSGDELTVRLRSANFGSPDHWLKQTKADVIFAFFGYNESFAGPAGLEKFKTDLDAFIKKTLKQQYNGKSSPRLVLFSPIAHENLHSPHLPDGSANNKRLELYSATMADVARKNKVLFVDLFNPTRDLYAKAAKPLTINGIHLAEPGNKLLAEVIDWQLFPGEPQPKREAKALQRVRSAVLDRNFYWFNRYRTVDGYSIYGGRASLPFVDGQTNFEVMQREMQVLDVMTANRDKRIWAVAQGKDLKVDDGNTPPFIPVKTNKPGTLPGGKHLYLGGEEAIKKMTLAKGMKINLFASEKEFPELVNAVQMSFDPQGRLWVAVWPTYPHWKPKEDMNDKILILEDTKGTGKADKCTVFADKLHCPTGFEFWNGGVLVAQAPDLMYLKDSKGTGKADVRLRVLHGLDSADTHHTANSFVLDPGGALYFQEGTFHHTQVETPWGPPRRNANAGVFRYEPRSQKFDVYINFGFANPHGHVFDHWGQDFVVDGTGANPYHAALFSGHLDYPSRHKTPPQLYDTKGIRPCPGMEILSSRHFPEANQGNLLVANVIGLQGIRQFQVKEKGSSFEGIEVEKIVTSTDPNFRPSDIRIGPDGAIYFLDWQNPIIGHMQHNLRDPSRGREHGRVYRIIYENRPLLKPVTIAGEPIEILLERLKEPEDRVRYRTRIELGGRDSKQVLAATKKWMAGLDRKDPNHEHHLLEALWLYQNHNVVNVDLLKRLLGSPEFRARAAATRVLCYWRDRVPEALELLKKQAADSHPRVRLEAVRAASFFKDPEAMEVPLIAAEHPSDKYLDYTRGETMRALDPHVKKAIDEGRKIPFTTLAGERFLLRQVSTDQLLKMKRTRLVCLELLHRKGVRDETRREAAAELAKIEKKNELQVLLAAIRQQDNLAASQDESVSFDLIRLLSAGSAKELTATRSELEKLATSAQMPLTRELGYVALIAADGGIDKAWALGTKSTSALQDLVNAMPLIRDPGQRASLYPKVELLLKGLPKELAVKSGSNSVRGRFVRIELPGKRKTLTLAEVEVYSDGRNIARQGKATQKNTANGGDASKAIDGNKSGSYGDGGQTHTEENTSNPWWEVDLKGEFPINSIVIYNRTEGNLGERLNNFTLKVLDRARQVVFEKKKQPAPAVKAVIEVSGEEPERVIRHAGMLALTSVRGQEAATFKQLARFVKEDADRHAAIQALQRIRSSYWPKDEAKPLLDDLLNFVRKVPLKERTTPVVLDAMQLADSLASLLPLKEARLIRKELGELGVRVIRMGTVPDQMLFDKQRIVVKAGKQVEILFENNDLMPHNLVVTQPGALEEIGTLAEATATQPGALERHYVPSSKKILHASRLLQPREVQKLSFTAPTQPGVYPYVCTYPGHWRRMYGAMYVVKDLDEYLADPDAYLAKNPLPAKDELLKFTRPRKEWKYEDLVASVEKLEGGRSFSNGKQMFQVATCVACHKMNGVGTEIGPDLTKLDPKQQKPAEILRDILEPSFRINEKYQSYVFETQAGKVFTGMILEETPQMVKIIENPLAKAEPIILKPADIADKKKSPTSIMPKGLLDQLTHEEILDLVAYIYARGDANHAVFRGEHEHGGKSGH